MTKTIKMTSKGQITIPRDIRRQMTSNIIEIQFTKQGILLNPVEDVGGSLGKLAKPRSFEDAREKAWTKVVHDKR